MKQENDWVKGEEMETVFETKCGQRFTQNKKLIGYKLIKPEYREAVREILKTCNDQHWFDSFFECNLDKKGYNFGNEENNEIKNIILESGVLGIWFEEIYEKESITLKSGVKLSEDDIAEVKELTEMRQICKDLSKLKKY